MVELRAEVGCGVRDRRYLARVRLRGIKVRRRSIATAAAAAAAGLIAVVLLVGGDGGEKSSANRASASIDPASGSEIRDSEEAQGYPEPASSDPSQLAADPSQVAADATPPDTGPSPGAPSDAEVRRQLRRLKRYQQRMRAGGAIGLGESGRAQAPAGSPAAVQDVVAGGNAIASFPYRLGGGHGSFVDDAYDCSGSVSYALATAGLLDAPLTSGELMKWGVRGRGRWITVYANPGHVFMAVGGVRFDTSGRAGRRGSRWQPLQRSAGGFVARHWPGL
jgi:cell wall-associated NlpC family hydrolase